MKYNLKGGSLIAQGSSRAVSQKITNKNQIYNYITSKTTNIQSLKKYIEKEKRGNLNLDITLYEVMFLLKIYNNFFFD